MANQSKNLIEGRVIKAISSKFFVDTTNGVKICFARKKLKLDGNIFVGDWVMLEKERDSFVIEKVIPRKNSLIRPYVSNIDICLITIAPEPIPDFLLVDRIIVNCLEQHIEPILVVNKTDIAAIDTTEYENIVKILRCSAETGEGTKELVEAVKGNTICFAGQSAVGKSSIINTILDSDLLEVGELTKKIKRGRHTTRRTEIIALEDQTYLIDTCGFSMLETIDIEPEDLRLYYDDFEQYRKECKFNSCTHIDEPECMVKPQIGIDIGKNRYQRYLTLYLELNDRRKAKYD